MFYVANLGDSKKGARPSAVWTYGENDWVKSRLYEWYLQFLYAKKLA